VQADESLDAINEIPPLFVFLTRMKGVGKGEATPYPCWLNGRRFRCRR
jgi:hypothetical protein